MLKITNPQKVVGNETTNLSKKSTLACGRGRGNNRFNQADRFSGRSRGRGSRRSTYTHYISAKVPETIYVDEKILYPTRIYQRSEYSQLTPSQKSELYKVRSANNVILTNDDSSTIDSCQISSTMTEIHDMLKARSIKVNLGDNTRSSQNDSSVASQFRKQHSNQN